MPCRPLTGRTRNPYALLCVLWMVRPGLTTVVRLHALGLEKLSWVDVNRTFLILTYVQNQQEASGIELLIGNYGKQLYMLRYQCLPIGY